MPNTPNTNAFQPAPGPAGAETPNTRESRTLSGHTTAPTPSTNPDPPFSPEPNESANAFDAFMVFAMRHPLSVASMADFGRFGKAQNTGQNRPKPAKTGQTCPAIAPPLSRRNISPAELEALRRPRALSRIVSGLDVFAPQLAGLSIAHQYYAHGLLLQFAFCILHFSICNPPVKHLFQPSDSLTHHAS